MSEKFTQSFKQSFKKTSKNSKQSIKNNNFLPHHKAHSIKPTLPLPLKYRNYCSDLNFSNFNFQSAISSDSSFVRKERSGTGITIPGVRSKILSFLNLSLEYRIINNAYLPQFFDQAYDINRIVTSSSNNQTIVRTKDMIIFESMSDSIKSSGLF